MEARYALVRKKLDELGYKQLFNVESLQLVEKLLNDLILQGEQLRRIHSRPEVTEFLYPALHPEHLVKHDISASLVKENNELQREIVKIKEKYEKDCKDLSSRLHALEGQNADLRFLNGQYLLKIQKLENESKLKSDKLQELQEKELQAVIQTAGSKKPFSFRHQHLKIDALLPPSSSMPNVPNQQKNDSAPNNRHHYVNVLRVADQRAAQLQSEIDALKIANVQAEELISSLKRQVEITRSENERLSRMADFGKPCSCKCIGLNQVYNDHLVVRLKHEIEHLQRFNHDLEKRLKQAINANLEGQVKSADLSAQNKQLELELNDVDKVAQALKKQKEELVSVADKEMAEAKLELEKFYSEISQLKEELEAVTKERNSLCQEKTSIAGELDHCKMQQERLKETLNQAEQDKKVLQDRFNEVVAKEHELQNKLIQQGNRPFDMGSATTTESYLNKVIQSIEKQRDYYKEMLEKLSVSSKLPNSEPSTSTPVSKHSEPSTPNINDDPLIKLLEQERDLYKNECWKLRKIAMPGAASVKDAEKIMQLQREVRKAIEEKEELNKTLELLEKHVEEVNYALEEMTQERDSWKEKCEKQGQQTQQMEKSEAVVPLKSAHDMLDVYHAQRERDVAKADLQKASIELEDLHQRLKLATEAQISERKRLEKRIADVEAELLASNAERSELLTKISSYKVLVASMEEQLQLLQSRFHELQNEASQEKSNANKLKILAEQTEKSFKEAQRILSQKVSERGQVEQKTRDLELKIEELNLVINKQNSELISLRRTVMAIDHEKDALQMDVDNKAEKIAELQQELLKKTNEIFDLRKEIGMLESRLDHVMGELLLKEKENKNLERQIELEKKETQNAIQSKDSTVRQLRKLQDDMLVMTNDHQVLEHDLHILQDERDQLKKQIQEYVSEVARIEELLRAKEQERTDLLEQFRSLTSTTSNLESHNSVLESEASNTRMELLAKETELRHSQDVIAALNLEIQNYLSQQRHSEQQLLNLQRNLTDSNNQLLISQQECERLQRELLSAREICVKLDTEKDRLTNELRNKDRELEKIEMSVADLKQHIESLSTQLISEKSEIENLERLLAANRQKEFITELQNRDLTDELNSIKSRLSKVEARLEEQLQNATRYRNRVTELEMEVDSLKRQLTNERFEREKLNQELRRLRFASPLEARSMLESTSGSAFEAARKDTAEAYLASFQAAPRTDRGVVGDRRPGVTFANVSGLPAVVVNPPSENSGNSGSQQSVHTHFSTSCSEVETQESHSHHQTKSSSTKNRQSN